VTKIRIQRAAPVGQPSAVDRTPAARAGFAMSQAVGRAIAAGVGMAAEYAGKAKRAEEEATAQKTVSDARVAYEEEEAAWDDENLSADEREARIEAMPANIASMMGEISNDELRGATELRLSEMGDMWAIGARSKVRQQRLADSKDKADTALFNTMGLASSVPEFQQMRDNVAANVATGLYSQKEAQSRLESIEKAQDQLLVDQAMAPLRDLYRTDQISEADAQVVELLKSESVPESVKDEVRKQATTERSAADKFREDVRQREEAARVNRVETARFTARTDPTYMYDNNRAQFEAGDYGDTNSVEAVKAYHQTAGDILQRLKSVDKPVISFESLVDRSFGAGVVKNADNGKAYDAYWTRQIESMPKDQPEVYAKDLAAISSGAGWVPPMVSTQWSATARVASDSGMEPQAAQVNALREVMAVKDMNPATDMGLTGDAAAFYEEAASLVRSGVSEQKSLQMAARSVYQIDSNASTARSEEWAENNADWVNEGLKEMLSSEMWDVPGWFKSDMGVDDLPTEMLVDYRVMARDQFFRTGNKTSALASAANMMSKKWGIATINGAEELMKNPPNPSLTEEYRAQIESIKNRQFIGIQTPEYKAARNSLEGEAPGAGDFLDYSQRMIDEGKVKIDAEGNIESAGAVAVRMGDEGQWAVVPSLIEGELYDISDRGGEALLVRKAKEMSAEGVNWPVAASKEEAEQIIGKIESVIQMQDMTGYDAETPSDYASRVTPIIVADPYTGIYQKKSDYDTGLIQVVPTETEGVYGLLYEGSPIFQWDNGDGLKAYEWTPDQVEVDSAAMRKVDKEIERMEAEFLKSRERLERMQPALPPKNKFYSPLTRSLESDVELKREKLKRAKEKRQELRF